MDAREFLKYVVDARRLAVLGQVACGARTAEQIAEGTGVAERDVVRMLAPLVHAGLVARDGAVYWLVPTALRELAQQLPQPEPPHPRVLMGMTEDEQAILRRFFSGERLVELPAAQSKRRVVLERLALDFEPGRRYSEVEVNGILGAYHDDYTTLRRYLVDEGFLARDGRAYWRSGGRVETAGDPLDE